MSNPNTGHGWVNPRPDGNVAKCGGPAICTECYTEKYGIGPPVEDEQPKPPALSPWGILEASRQAQEKELEILRAKAACYDWLRSGKKYRQGQPLPNVGIRIIDHNEDRSVLSFMFWVSPEKLDEAILAEIAKEAFLAAGVKV